MGAQNSLQAAINALLRHFNARQRPADFIDIQRIDDPPARTQQRAGVKIEHRRGKRPAQLRGQSGIKIRSPSLASPVSCSGMSLLSMLSLPGPIFSTALPFPAWP